MAFFVDLGKMVSKGTKNLTENARLNASILENRRKIEKLYSSLGQAYFEAHKNDPAPEQPALMEELNKLSAAIAQAEKELNEMKNRGKCPNCGAEVPQGALFCPVCGTKQPQPQPAAPAPAPAQKFCPGCGAQVNATNKFCNLCGTPLEPSAPPIVQPSVFQPPVMQMPDAPNPVVPAAAAPAPVVPEAEVPAESESDLNGSF